MKDAALALGALLLIFALLAVAGWLDSGVPR